MANDFTFPLRSGGDEFVFLLPGDEHNIKFAGDLSFKEKLISYSERKLKEFIKTKVFRGRDLDYFVNSVIAHEEDLTYRMVVLKMMLFTEEKSDITMEEIVNRLLDDHQIEALQDKEGYQKEINFKKKLNANKFAKDTMTGFESIETAGYDIAFEHFKNVLYDGYESLYVNFDIGNLKSYNDYYGKSFMDEVIGYVINQANTRFNEEIDKIENYDQLEINDKFLLTKAIMEAVVDEVNIGLAGLLHPDLDHTKEGKSPGIFLKFSIGIMDRDFQDNSEQYKLNKSLEFQSMIENYKRNGRFENVGYQDNDLEKFLLEIDMEFDEFLELHDVEKYKKELSAENYDWLKFYKEAYHAREALKVMYYNYYREEKEQLSRILGVTRGKGQNMPYKLPGLGLESDDPDEYTSSYKELIDKARNIHIAILNKQQDIDNARNMIGKIKYGEKEKIPINQLIKDYDINQHDKFSSLSNSWDLHTDFMMDFLNPISTNTGLESDNHFEEDKERLLNNSNGKLHVAFLDFSLLSTINNELGDDKGNIYLREIARLLRQTMHSSDILVYHRYGSNFSVVSKDIELLKERLKSLKDNIEHFNQKHIYNILQLSKDSKDHSDYREKKFEDLYDKRWGIYGIGAMGVDNTYILDYETLYSTISNIANENIVREKNLMAKDFNMDLTKHKSILRSIVGMMRDFERFHGENVLYAGKFLPSGLESNMPSEKRIRDAAKDLAIQFNNVNNNKNKTTDEASHEGQ
jgi:GGDEF domain-containing protein